MTGTRPKTVSISMFLAPHVGADLLPDLEAARLTWERIHGPTDITKYYTSRWPLEAQRQLYDLDFHAYFYGRPPYFQDMIRQRMKSAATRGSIDNMPDEYIRLYCFNGMRNRGDSPRSR